MSSEAPSTPTTPRFSNWRFDWRTIDGRTAAAILVVLLTLVGTGLRFWNLDREPLHVDELWQVRHVQQPLGEIIGLSHSMIQPPLDYLLGKAVVSVAPATDFTQRIPAAVSGSLAVGLVGLILFRRRMYPAAVLGTLFMAVYPLLVENSQYARPYALPMATVLGTLAVYQHWHLGAKTWKTTAAFVVVGALAFNSHSTFPVITFVVLGIVAAATAISRGSILDPRGLLRSDPLALVALPILFVVTYLPNLPRMSGGIVTPCLTCDKWGKLGNGVTLLGDYGELAVRPLSLVRIIAVGGVLLFIPVVRASLKRIPFLWVPMLASGPLFALSFALTTQSGQGFAIRYLVFLPAGLAIFFAIAFGSIFEWLAGRERVARVVVGVPLMLLIVSASVAMLNMTRRQSVELDLADWRSAADYIEDIEQPGDFIMAIDTRPFRSGNQFGFEAAPRYWDGDAPFQKPIEMIKDPSIAAAADRYHFVLYVPKMAEGWTVPEGWEFQEYSEIYILTTGSLADASDRVDAWWRLAGLLRPDVAPRTQIAGVALEHALGTDRYPWTDNVYEQAEAWGQVEFADSLMSIATG